MADSMRWRRVEKGPQQKRKGTYEDWKPDLAVEADHQCVYCALHDSRFGGIRNFHVEHFEPKSKAPAKTNDWANLFYACPVCNVFKGDDWPVPPSPNAYVDPSKVDYETIFRRLTDSVIGGNVQAASYMVERLYLNRPQLRLERKEAALRARWNRARVEVQELLRLGKCTRDLPKPTIAQGLKCFEIMCRIDELLDRLWRTTPYEASDVRRS